MIKYVYASSEAEKMMEEGGSVVSIAVVVGTISHTVYTSTCCSKSSNCWV